MAEAHKVILLRGTGAGKTQLAPARGIAGIRQEKWIRFFNDVDLFNQLDRTQQAGKLGVRHAGWVVAIAEHSRTITFPLALLHR